jgi:xanthine dehydrogenase accessory factor
VGAKAIIHVDGSIEGWISGACAEPSVIREAQAAIADGVPRLVFLGRPGELDRRAEDGMVTIPMACDSEGAVEVYLEPVLPRPHVVVIGRSPAVRTLAALVGDLDWRVTVIDDGSVDIADRGIDAATAVVVATQGHYDDLALEAALATEAGYIGLVASTKRAEATLALLRDRGLPPEQLLRVVAPAGLDLGAVDNAEIGVAVLADLVARRAAGRLFGPVTVAAPAELATDPVCGMLVDVASAKYHCVHDGADQWFCSAGCKAAFEGDPAAYS